MAALDGGIKASKRAAEAASTTTKGVGYPCSIIFGIIIVPTAVMAASMDPQNAAKKPIATTIATPSPPGQCPTRAVQKFTSLVAAPPLNITIPAKMNRGTATNICLVKAAKEICINTDQGRFNPHIAAIEDPKPNTINIGTAKSNRINDRDIDRENIWLVSFTFKVFEIQNFL